MPGGRGLLFPRGSFPNCPRVPVCSTALLEGIIKPSCKWMDLAWICQILNRRGLVFKYPDPKEGDICCWPEIRILVLVDRGPKLDD